MTVRLAWEKAVIIAPACGRTLARYDPTRKAIMWEGPKIRALTDISYHISISYRSTLVSRASEKPHKATVRQIPIVRRPLINAIY